MKKLIVLFAALLVTLMALPALASQIRVYVGEMNAIGNQNKDEMKATLQMLLASRLNSDSITAVGNSADADVTVTGTYVMIGKIFSVDALAKNTTGKVLTRAFVQGESQDDLIPAIGKLADKLSSELSNLYGSKPAATVGTAAPKTIQPAAPIKSDIIKAEQQVDKAPTGDFIKPAEYEKNTSSGWLSRRLPGAANLIATGRIFPDGSREIFLAEERRLAYYRQATEMKLVAEVEFKNSEKILSVDSTEGKDGTIDVYVTIIRSEELASQVWQVKDNKLVVVAEKLPWFFRSINLAGGAKKMYAQAMGRDTDFYGEVAEVTRNGSAITLKNPIKLPRYGDIYSFNQFRTQDDKTYTIVINPDGYLVVYDQDLSELWRSNDKFGGSELYFQKEDPINVRVTGDRYRWIFMNQRVQVTSKGEVLVGKNDGFWVLGNARSYKRGAVFCLAWNGSSLEEKWRTRDTQNYMPDYYFDESKNELLILQTVQRPSIATRGASSLSIKKVE